MANEYLSRVPTSTGNQRVFTISVWIKRGASGNHGIFGAGDGSSAANSDHFWLSSDVLGFSAQDGTNYINASPLFRDISSWTHYHYIHKTDDAIAADRGQLFVNGVRLRDATSSTFSINQVISWMNKAGAGHAVGARNRGGYSTFMNGEMSDFFFIDGQALTPDVFGFYKQGKGYISAGSTQATDFRPGQWVPKTPRVIKTEINRRGGFGVNGFYLPMNDSSNFGADFHGEPNSIITLKGEDLPQPRVGVASTAAVGLGFTDVLRADPYAANLVLALPFVSGGTESGFGDYSHIIRGSGSAKSITNTGVSIASTASYYGSGSYFDSGNYLSTPNVSDFQFGTGDFTMEAWAYSFSGSWSIVAAQGTTGDAGRTLFGISNTGAINTQIGSQSLSSSAGIATSAQWNHIALVRKNGVGTIYLNGVCVGINTVYTNSIQNTTLYVGSDQGWTNTSSKMYLQDLRVYKGVAKYTGGFDVPRPYTPVGIATWRQVPDTTANNFATQQPTNGSSSQTLTDGNLTQVSSSTAWNTIRGSVGVSTGKWYWEVRMSGSANTIMVGVDDNLYQVTTNPSSSYVGAYSNSWSVYLSDGNKRNNTGSGSAYGSSFLTGDICMVALDTTNGRIFWGKNGTWFNSGDPVSGTNAAYTNLIGYSQLMPATSTFDTNSRVNINFGQNPTFSGNTTSGTFTDTNGEGLFKYQPPSDFLALCEDNLPTPAISDPGKYFKTVLYAGDDSNSMKITGVGFQPDLVWFKKRTGGSQNHTLFDSVRGSTQRLFPNATDAESTQTDHVLSFDNDGFSIGGNNFVNDVGQNYVAWCWRAGAGTTSTNTNGSITSVVSVNQDAGFSIVSWTGNGSSTATVGHGLGKTPAFLISKARSGTNEWWVVHKSGNGNLQLNATLALITSGGTNGAMGFPSTLTNNTFTFTAGSSSVNNVNASGTTYVTYCWAEIEGFSKFGSFVGNGSADGVFVYTGFRPALVIIKRTDTTDSWAIFDSSRDSANPVERLLRAEGSNVEATMTSLVSNPFGDFLSNGFKVRNTSTIDNVSGGSYIFAAWAESPFQTANSK